MDDHDPVDAGDLSAVLLDERRQLRALRLFPGRQHRIEAFGVQIVEAWLVPLGTYAGGRGPSQGVVEAVGQDDEPIWRDRMATGAKATTGIANTMGVQVDETRDAALAEATSLALDKLIARYREQAGAPAAK